MVDEENIVNKYDLEERTAEFAEEIIKFAKTVQKNGTSIGANYCEADDAESSKDFVHKIGICKKEARETKYWLRTIVVAAPEIRDNSAKLWQEAKELHLIFNSISRKIKLKNSDG